jgi:hypothetical protein
MKKALLFASFIFLLAMSVAAQKPAAAPDAPELKPDQWKEYSYAEDNVRFRLPAEPDITKTSKDNTHKYARESAVTFDLTVSDAGIDVGKDRTVQQKYLILISMSLDQEIKSSGAKLIKREDTKVDGNPALFVQYESKDGIVTRAKIFALKDRVYMATTEVEKSEQQGANSENDLERSALAFLDSIHLISN